VFLNKNRVAEVLKRDGISLAELAEELCVTSGEALRLVAGTQSLEYRTAQLLMNLIGFEDFAYVAESEEVRRLARNIKYEFGRPFRHAI